MLPAKLHETDECRDQARVQSDMELCVLKKQIDLVGSLRIHDPKNLCAESHARDCNQTVLAI